MNEPLPIAEAQYHEIKALKARIAELEAHPAPVPAILSREAAIKLANKCAGESKENHGYLDDRLCDRNWRPHDWVVNAILAAARPAPDAVLEFGQSIIREMRGIAPNMKMVNDATMLDMVPFFADALLATRPAPEKSNEEVMRALKAIATFPITEIHSNSDAINMRQMAIDAIAKGGV